MFNFKGKIGDRVTASSLGRTCCHHDVIKISDVKGK